MNIKILCQIVTLDIIFFKHPFDLLSNSMNIGDFKKQCCGESMGEGVILLLSLNYKFEMQYISLLETP